MYYAYRQCGYQDKEGGKKAYNILVDEYKRLAHIYREFIEEYDGDGGETKRGYRKYYPFFDENYLTSEAAASSILRENAAAPEKEPNILVKGIDAVAKAISTKSEAQ